MDRKAKTLGGNDRTERPRKGPGGGLEARVVTVALVSTVAALLAAFSVYQYRNWSADRAEMAAESLRLAQAIGAAAHDGVVSGDLKAQALAARLLDGSENAVAAAYSDLQGHRMQLTHSAGEHELGRFKGQG